MRIAAILGVGAFVFGLGGPAPVAAQDNMKMAIGQCANWDISGSEIGHRMGFFRRHSLQFETLYTQGSGETQQGVISNSFDVGVAAGVMGVLSAFSKGAPVRIIGAEAMGAQIFNWYVRANSPIRSLKDTNGRTIAFSTNGSSTHSIVMAFIRQANIAAHPMATGGPPATLAQVMSGQIDIGWTAPPFGFEQLDRGEIRIIASGNEAQVFRGQTIRLPIANAQTLQRRKAVIDRYMAAYLELIHNPPRISQHSVS